MSMDRIGAYVGAVLLVVMMLAACSLIVLGLVVLWRWAL